MNYNDYPILDEQAYQFLKEKYNNVITFDRSTLLVKLVNTLEECKGLCLGIKNINLKLKKSISNNQNQITNILENLSTIFNIHPTCVEIKEFNVFLLINKMLVCTQIIQKWLQNESKEYYKQTLIGHQSILLTQLIDITQILNNSNIIMFKHM